MTSFRPIFCHVILVAFLFLVVVDVTGKPERKRKPKLKPMPMHKPNSYSYRLEVRWNFSESISLGEEWSKIRRRSSDDIEKKIQAYLKLLPADASDVVGVSVVWWLAR